MWRPLVVLALLAFLPVYGSLGAPGKPVTPQFEVPLQPGSERGELDAAAYAPTWRIVLHRLFRKGLRRLLLWGTSKLKYVQQGDGFLSTVLYFATTLIAGLLGPCGRLWRWLVG